MTTLTGINKLRAAVDKDLSGGGTHDYEAKFEWILARAEHYAEKTGLSRDEILNAWEEKRNYWYMNFYQEAEQPEIKGDKVRVFDTITDLLESIGDKQFRCPLCEGVTANPYACNSGIKTDGKVCDWKVYGFLGALGKGAHVFVKEKVAIEHMFMPIAWEGDK